MKMTDGKRTVDIQLRNWNGSGYDPDWSTDFFTAGNLPYNAEQDMYTVQDVDYCVNTANDAADGDMCVLVTEIVAKKEQMVEAAKRMRIMGTLSQTIKQFEKSGHISISEPPLGAFYWAEGDDLAAIREFEAKHNALVYMVIRSYTEFGKLDSYLFVGDEPEIWDAEQIDLKHHEALAYVRNTDCPDMSELGYIGFERTIAAGFRRTW